MEIFLKVNKKLSIIRVLREIQPFTDTSGEYTYTPHCFLQRTLEFASREAFANFLSFIQAAVKELELPLPVNIQTAFDPPQIESFQFGPFVNEIVCRFVITKVEV